MASPQPDPPELHESIIPMINVCRKVESCDKSQLITTMNSLPQQSLIELVMNGICASHKTISPEIFDNILNELPTERQLAINDSITKSDIESPQKNKDKKNKKREKLTLLKIHKDLKIVIFNFLKEEDLINVQKTCRCLNISARDPNALKYLKLYLYDDPDDEEYEFTSTKYDKDPFGYLHPWYSRIQRLDIRIWYERLEPLRLRSKEYD